MKAGLAILLCALLLGIVSHYSTRLAVCHCGSSDSSAIIPHEGDSRLPELHWLQQWLQLEETHMQKVRALHLAYLPQCEQLCHRIKVLDEKIYRLSVRQTTLSPSIEAALSERAQLATTCQHALLKHVYATAAVMPAEQASQYLATMVPYTLGSHGSIPTSHE